MHNIREDFYFNCLVICDTDWQSYLGITINKATAICIAPPIVPRGSVSQVRCSMHTTSLTLSSSPVITKARPLSFSSSLKPFQTRLGACRALQKALFCEQETFHTLCVCVAPSVSTFKPNLGEIPPLWDDHNISEHNSLYGKSSKNISKVKDRYILILKINIPAK